MKLKETDKETKFLNKVLTRMFKMVGLKFDVKYTQEEDWWLTKTWTEEQRLKFKRFFIEEARKKLRYNKKQAINEFAWFDLMFGWKMDE